MQTATTSKRDHILTATRDLIFEQGLQSTSMAQITKAAGVGMGTVYNYFSGKEALVNVLYSELRTQMSAYVLGDYDAGQPVVVRFLQLCDSIMRYGIAHPRDFQFVEQFTYSPYIQATLRDQDFGLLGQFSQLIAEAHEQQLLKDLPFEMSLSLTYGALASMVRGHSAGKLRLDDEQIQKAAAACWDAVKR